MFLLLFLMGVIIFHTSPVFRKLRTLSIKSMGSVHGRCKDFLEKSFRRTSVQDGYSFPMSIYCCEVGQARSKLDLLEVLVV